MTNAASTVKKPAGGQTGHPRDRDCPGCEAKVGDPCRLENGTSLSDIHCTVRVTGNIISPSWRPPSYHKEAPAREKPPDPSAAPQKDTGLPDKSSPERPEPAPADENPAGQPGGPPRAPRQAGRGPEEAPGGDAALFTTRKRQPALF